MINRKTLDGGVILIIIALVVISAGFAIYMKASDESYSEVSTTKEEFYSVVSTTSGEFYVGKLSKPVSGMVKLTNAFILQNVKTTATDPGSLQLIPLSQSLWMPEAIYFNIENVVFTGRVGEKSQVAETVKKYYADMVAVPPSNQPIVPAPAGN